MHLVVFEMRSFEHGEFLAFLLFFNDVVQFEAMGDWNYFV